MRAWAKSGLVAVPGERGAVLDVAQAAEGSARADSRGGPRLAVHFDATLAISGERNPGDRDFEIFISLKIFDRNSNLRFHKSMVAIGLQKSPMHDAMHGPSFNNSWALDSTVCGASFAQFWVVSDATLDLVGRDVVSGSVPDQFGSFYRSLMYGALTLGIPKYMSVRDQNNAPRKNGRFGI